MSITDLLTALYHAGITSLDLDPAGNRLRCLPETPQALRAALVQHKAALLALADEQRCTVALADLLAEPHAPVMPAAPPVSYTGVCAMPGGYHGPTGDVADYDARRLVARLYVLKGQPDEADRILAGDWTRYRALYDTEGLSYAQ